MTSSRVQRSCSRAIAKPPTSAREQRAPTAEVLRPVRRATKQGYMDDLKSGNALVTGPVFRFADWPNDQVPRRAAGVYTIWRQEEFIYVGMSGRGAKAEDFVAGQGQEGQAKGMWTRLASHASGRRSGDQFNVYICDRFVIPAMTPEKQQDIGQGTLLLDQMTKD